MLLKLGLTKPNNFAVKGMNVIKTVLTAANAVKKMIILDSGAFDL